MAEDEPEGAPRVSYVLASYNHADHVGDAVRSILAQDYPDIELVVVDDGSTDGSPEILRGLRREFGFTLLEKPNGGIVSALNAGVKLTTGRFVVPHASDDVSHPGRTARQVRVLLDDETLGFTVGAIRKIDSAGAVLRDWPAPVRRTFDFSDFRSGRGRAFAVSCMYRADVLKAVMPLDESLAFEDVQLYWRVTHGGFRCAFRTDIRAVDYRILTNSLGRADKVRLREDYLRFVRRYDGEDWYGDVVRRATGRLVLAIALADRRRGARELAARLRTIGPLDTAKVLAAIVLPAALVARFRQRF